jgi:hypothetical protein
MEIKKVFIAAVCFSLIFAFSLPAGVFTAGFSFFDGKDCRSAVSSRYNLLAHEVWNLIDVSQKIAKTHASMAKKFFSAAFCSVSVFGDEQTVEKAPEAQRFENDVDFICAGVFKYAKESLSFFYYIADISGKELKNYKYMKAPACGYLSCIMALRRSSLPAPSDAASINRAVTL